MDKKLVEQRMIELCDQIARHEFLYYVKAKPEISDQEFDLMFNRLLELEKQYPDLVVKHSPSKRVGSDLDNLFPEITHTIPILSLDKCYSIEELMAWIIKIQNKVNQKLTFSAEEKMDGVSVILSYNDGILYQAATRGNGLIGNDITQNVMTIPSIPLKLTNPVTLTVRGEIFIQKSDFQKLKQSDDNSYDSPRNLSAGALRRKNSKETAKIPLQSFIYEGISGEFDASWTHESILSYLQSLGFKTNPSTHFFQDDPNQWHSYIQQVIQTRNKLNYDIDGLVIKINEINPRQILGATDRFPRWAIAFKFSAPEAVTIIEDITCQIGRLGRITPVARLKPIHLNNATITNATLHNQEYIDALDIAIGDSVMVSRRGDVIPAIERVIEKNNSQTLAWKMPDQCISCHSPLIKDGAHHFCPNENCPERLAASLIHFVGKTGMDIENLGPQTIRLLIDQKMVRTPQDIYSLNYDQLVGLPGFGEKKIALLKQGIENSKKQPFETVLAAIGIKELGKATIKLLIDSGITSIDQFIRIATENDISSLIHIKGISTTIAHHIISSIQSPALLQTIDAFRRIGLSLKTEKSKEFQLSDIMKNQKWCITGSFNHFKPRDLAAHEIEKRGGTIVNSVSSKTTHLLVGDNPGSKYTKAKQLNIQVINEQEFLSLISSTD